MDDTLTAPFTIAMPAKTALPTLVRLHRDTPGHLRIFEQVIPRIVSFSYRFGENGELTGQEVWQKFSAKDPGLFLLAAMEGERLVGHTLAFFKWLGDEPYVWVLQTEIERRSERVLINEWLQSLDTWARELNLQLEKQNPASKRIRRIQAQSPRITEAWSRHVGFIPRAVILERLIP